MKEIKTDSQEEKKKLPTTLIVLIISIVLFGVFLGIGFISPATGAFLLSCLCVGCIIASISMIVLFVLNSRYTCPQCGTKRIHHKRLIETKTTTVQGNVPAHTARSTQATGHYTETRYRYKYLETYTCPECGETLERNTEEWGGTYRAFASGQFEDRRKQPKEF